MWAQNCTPERPQHTGQELLLKTNTFAGDTEVDQLLEAKAGSARNNVHTGSRAQWALGSMLQDVSCKQLWLQLRIPARRRHRKGINLGQMVKIKVLRFSSFICKH